MCLDSGMAELKHNPEAHRYEAWEGGRLVGFADYTVAGNVVTLPHTEVDPAFGGQGIGAEIVRFALDDIRAMGQTVVPACSFVARWIQRHPAYQDLLNKLV